MTENKQFEIRLNEPGILKDALSVTGSFFSEATFKVTKEHIYLCGMDPANVSLVELELLSSSASVWNINQDEYSFSVNIENINNIFKNLKKDDILKIWPDENNLILNFIGESDRDYKVPFIELDIKEQKVPELNHKATVNLESKRFYNQIKEAGTVSESVLFKVTGPDAPFILSAVSDLNQLNIKNKPGADINIKIAPGDAAICKYSIEYLKKIADAKKVSDTVKLSFSNDYPLIAEYYVLDKLRLKFILAPRVSNDE